jgi:hypothetical protein
MRFSSRRQAVTALEIGANEGRPRRARGSFGSRHPENVARPHDKSGSSTKRSLAHRRFLARSPRHHRATSRLVSHRKVWRSHADALDCRD